MMMKIKYPLMALTMAAVCAGNIHAQEIVKIGNTSVSTSDFKAMYEKNNKSNGKTLTPEEYLQLFVNFKLKVIEAENLKMDEEPAFVNELSGYREQLIKPYLINDDINKSFIEESYANMQYDIRASHILIEVPKYATGKDTVAAWNKIMEIRKMALEGEDFNDLAYKYSEDPSAREREYQGFKYPANRGDLGYFTAFNMIYPFEHAAYNMKVGEISMPVRTIYGYHLIYLTDKQPAMGKCVVSHILLRVPENKTHDDTLAVMKLADNIYDSIMNGMSFADAAKKYSEDKTSASAGGRLIPFTCNQLEANFIKEVTLLHDSGQISKPFFTIYGCHIIQLQHKSGIGSLEEEMPEIEKKLKQGDREDVEIHAVINKLKEKYNFTENILMLDEIIPYISANFTKLDSLTIAKPKTMFTYSDKMKNQQEFVSFLSSKVKKNTTNSATTIRSLYDEFVNSTMLEEESFAIEKNNQEYRLLIQEYHDGILLFNINEEYVWNKATADTIALMNFYNQHKDKYMWKDRVKATLFKVYDKTILDKAVEMAEKGMDDKELVMELNKGASALKMKMERDDFEKDENKIIEMFEKKIGLTKVVSVDGVDYFARIYQIMPATNKTFDECKGLVISDYQNHIDEQWMNDLKDKYKVVVNKKELKKIR